MVDDLAAPEAGGVRAEPEAGSDLAEPEAGAALEDEESDDEGFELERAEGIEPS